MLTSEPKYYVLPEYLSLMDLNRSSENNSRSELSKLGLNPRT